MDEYRDRCVFRIIDVDISLIYDDQFFIYIDDAGILDQCSRSVCFTALLIDRTCGRIACHHFSSDDGHLILRDHIAVRKLCFQCIRACLKICGCIFTGICVQHDPACFRTCVYHPACYDRKDDETKMIYGKIRNDVEE